MHGRSRSRSRSRQCSGDALANRLKLLLKSQKNGFEKRAELATLLTEITGDTSDSVIEEMANSVAELKDDTELQAAFLNGMTDNLVGDKLTTSGRNVVLKAFTNRCGNLKRVLTIERAFETLRGAQTSPDKRPQTPEDSRLSNCGGKKRQVVWLVDQTEAGQPGFWREARLCGPDMEKQYQDGEETSDVAVGSGCGQVQYYTHRMTQNEMQQLRFHDQARSDLIFDRELAQASMQTSRDDQSQSDPKDIPTETELHSPEKNPVVLPKTLPKPADAATPSPTVPAADESSTGNSLSGDCANAPDTAPRNELVGVSKKKRSASCRGEDGEDDEDGEECAAATKLRRGEDGEEGQTRIVTTIYLL